MDGQVTHHDDDTDIHVRKYVTGVQAMVVGLQMAHRGSMQIREAAKGFAANHEKDGVGGILGDGLSRIMNAIANNAVEEVIAGNGIVARRAERHLGVDLPTDYESYEWSIEDGSVHPDDKEDMFR